MLTFIKRTATSWQHDNGTVKSSFGGGIPITNDTENTIVFQLPNGTNFPIKAQLIPDCKIIDKTDGDAEYTFATTTEFLDKLEELNYPYINTGGGGGAGTNIGFTSDKTSGTITSSTGSDASVPTADGTNAGLSENNVTDGEKSFLLTAGGLDLADYAKTDAVIVAIGEALTTAETYTDNALENYTNTTDLNTALGAKADNSLFLIQQSDRTLTSNTSAQDIFDVGVGGDGSITLDADSTYHFEMELSMTGLSTTAGTISISFDAGTVGVGIFKASSVAKKAGFGNASTPQFVFFDTTSVLPVVATSTVTTANVFINGVIVTSTAGTFRPRVTMSQASASTVQKGAHLIMSKLGSNSDTHYPTE